MELSALAKNRAESITRPVEITIGEDVLHAVIRPAGISTATMVRLQGLQREVEKGGTPPESAYTLMPQFLSELIVSWDLTDGGEPVPTTLETLAAMPIDTLSFLVEALQEAANATPLPTSAS